MENNTTLKFLNIDTSLYKTRISKKFQNRKSYQPIDPKKINSFIPCTVLNIMVVVGQQVDKNDELMILDAMKMQNKLKSPVSGKIKSILVKKGDRVPKGILLIELV
jgi:biotin carboxyl carrier protein